MRFKLSYPHERQFNTPEDRARAYIDVFNTPIGRQVLADFAMTVCRVGADAYSKDHNDMVRETGRVAVAHELLSILNYVKKDGNNDGFSITG